MDPDTPAKEVKKQPTNPTKIIVLADGLSLLFSMGLFIYQRAGQGILNQILRCITG
jgi:hypothetical protein